MIKIVLFLFLSNVLMFNTALAKPVSNPIRALHIVLRGLALEDGMKLVDMAVAANFNTLIVDPRDQVKFKFFPGKVLPDAWSVDELMSMVRYSQEKGLVVIPEVKLLTHQRQLLGESHPDFMFDKETYNPKNKLVYSVIFPYLDELITLMHPPSIHIGHDEVQGVYRVKNYPIFSIGMLSSELFYKDIMMLHDYLAKQGVTTWMWGDMLIGVNELPMMNKYHLNGVKQYGRNIRKRLPKDIVICDWHYVDKQIEFPSIGLFKDDGFEVLGATFRDSGVTENFSHYAAQHGAGGMIATTWFIKGHNNDKLVNTWGKLSEIITISGTIFIKDFPDAK